ncbi:Pirin-domain-containing protein [Gonapodya prolifera JEL478]|uniref:Pirin-domain-containing protein n=1 Tax=Gonapodya prolifera (strain JEL478) TaxID=1344416 RepID=A0A139AZF5_GONPJ|nr:Pirin-domain-containing protein [Gonapodya prolifera JEL478]|eukprot:KXS22094.1 Pirin-domain-containing protein [Gonapodya prolifera JEL478]
MSALEIIAPKVKELVVGISVRRLLPSYPTQTVGPFIFLDHMGSPSLPTTLPPPLSVPPHPHIGLSTVTFLFRGALLHRDSLGTSQVIRPGDVNIMHAGRGVVHSERPVNDTASAEDRQPLHGIQFWSVLPPHLEHAPASFQHATASSLPEFHLSSSSSSSSSSPPSSPSSHAKLLIGSRPNLLGSFSLPSPVTVPDPDTLYAALFLHATPASYTSVSPSSPASPTADGSIPVLASDAPQRAVYSVDAPGVTIRARGRADLHVPQFHLAVLKEGEDVYVVPPPAGKAGEVARAVVLGGAKVERRHVWWNYVATSSDHIARARAHWGALTEPESYPSLAHGEDNLFETVPGEPGVQEYIRQPGGRK